jgi:transposase
MEGKRRKYSKEYKLQIIRMVKDEGKIVSQLAEELGINENLIYRWVRQYEKHSDYFLPGEGKPTERDEIRRLKRKLAVVTEENEILKKVMAIFSKQPGKNSR